MPDVFQDLLATDEQVAERAVTDYPLLAPRKEAAGLDGVLSSASPWVLTSATTDFGARGVQSGHVAILTRTDRPDKPTDMFAVASASGNTLTLRQIGSDAGTGQPPGPASGSITAVDFKVLSCVAQLRDATRRIKEDLGMPSLTGADVASAGYSETFEDAAVNRALYWLYLAKAREGSASLGGAGRVVGSEFYTKAMEYKSEYESILATLKNYYGVDVTIDTGPAAPTVGIFRLNVRGVQDRGSEVG